MHTIHPIREMRQLDRAMAQLFREPLFQPNSGNSEILSVPVDTVELEDSLMIRAVVPGISPDQLNLTIENQVLTLQGEWVAPELPENARVLRQESVFGKFQRSFRIRGGYNLDSVSAKFSHGIVTITIPKLEEVKPQSVRIPISAE